MYPDLEKSSFFTKDNFIEDSKRLVEIGAGYLLTIEGFRTKPGCFGYSQGTITRDGELVSVVQRNYSHFPYAVVQHNNGFTYLICGEDYQGITLIELETGKRKEYLPPEAAKGWGFCAYEWLYNKESELVLATGCYWGAPDEFKFFDFSDPMSDYREIKIPKNVDSDVCSRVPSFENDGTIKVYQTRYEPDDDSSSLNEIVAYSRLKRNEFNFELVESYVSDEEKERRLKYQAEEIARGKELDDFKKSDPLHAIIMGKLGDQIRYTSHGITFDGWCPTWSGKEQRFVYSFADSKDIEFGILSSPVKISSPEGKQFFERTEKGLQEAISALKLLDSTSI